MAVFQDTDIYCITDEKHSKGRDNIFVVKKMLESGIKIIQYREKFKPMKEKYLECIEIRELTKKYNSTFIVNDHVDLAILCNADGVHIGQDDLPLKEVRKIMGSTKIIGISTHNPSQAVEAEKSGADYIGVGPIFKTSTKVDVCEPVGLTYLDFVVRNIKIPFVAIGGIKEKNLLSVVERGARCAALVTEITEAENIEEKILNLRKIFKL
ncbi:MAG: thiamine phosphate synthase [Desulforegulaceae bacterium]|nr:thiamine phosphate synthase [Desulforegulaceae bacterium]